MAKSVCVCGAERDQRALELVRSFRCPACGSAAEVREPVSRPGAAAGGGGAPAWQGGPRPGDDASTVAAGRALDETGSVFVVTPGGGAGSAPALAANTRLGAYAIRSLIGSGGMGTVYLAHEPALDRDVAVKVISPALCVNPLFVERFRREARTAASLAHANITTIFAIGEEKGTHFYAMELVRGKSLAEHIASRGRFAPREAAALAAQAAEGLREAARRQVIHRDVKPSNLLLSESGALKITDFGLAKAFLRAVEDTTTTGVVMGTPLYMSPEQGAGRPADHRSDIYSLGVTLYQLIFGRPPFSADTPLALMVKHLQEEPEVPLEGAGAAPAPLAAVLRKMLAKDPERRYASYELLLADLRAFLEGRPVAAAREVPAADDGALTLRRRAPGGAQQDGASTMARSRLSIARASLQTARVDRALGFLREVLRDETVAETRCEAALLLAEVCEKEGDPRGAREALEVLAREARDPVLSAYAQLKLAQIAGREALARDRALLGALEKLAAAAPRGVPLEKVQARVRALRARIEAAAKVVEREKVELVEGE